MGEIRILATGAPRRGIVSAERAGGGATRSLRIVAYVVGMPLSALGAVMLATAMVEIVAEASIWLAFFVGGAVTTFVGVAAVLATRGHPVEEIGLRGAFLLTVASWTATGLFAAIPLVLAPGDHS